MLKISQITHAITEINDAVFQELCNHFLSFKYGFSHLSAIGSVIGKEKTKKGTPDTFFLNSDNTYTFVEHTTQTRIGKSQSFYRKIADDIQKCFDPEKSGVTNEKISRIIICHTGKLTPKELTSLIQKCNSFNPKVKFEQYGIDDLAIELQKYPSLVETYLGLKYGTGQLVNVEEFIAIYEKPDLKLATPLGNNFLGREKEISEALNLLQEQNLLLITGSSGVGKTKFAIELCNKFIENNETFQFRCIADKGISLYDDLQRQLENQQEYIILIDDANRSSNYNFVLYLLQSNRTGKIKIIATVRDYALETIRETSYEYFFAEIRLESLSEEAITAILKSPSFNIQNQKYIDKINAIARGNIRIAVMCAIVAQKHQSLTALDNISKLYEFYFKDAYEKIQATGTNALKTLGIISFFRVISKEQTETNKKIFSIFPITEDEFWKECFKLNKLEFVDLFENQVVKISDQILSTHLFYKTFFDTKELDFSALINNFIEFETNFIDSINPLLIAYDFKNIKNKLEQVISNEWENLKSKLPHFQILKILSIFWFCIENKCLAYFHEYISELPICNNPEYKFDYEHNQMSSGYTKDILSILSNFRYSQKNNLRIALELMLLYVEREPQQAPHLAYLLKEYWKFNRFSHETGDFSQHQLIDFLIEKSTTENRKELYRDLLKVIVPTLLNTRFIEHENRGNTFYMYTHHTILTPSIKELRKKIWNFIAQQSDLNSNFLYQIILDLQFDNYDQATELWEYDSTIVLPILKQLNYQDFKACEVTEHYLTILSCAKVNFHKSIEKIATNRLFKLSKLLLNESKRFYYRDNDNIQRKKIFRYCQKFNLENYISLLKDIIYIIANSSQKKQWDIVVTYIAESTIEQSHELFYQFLNYLLEYHSFQLWAIRLLNIYFQSNPKDYNSLFECLEKNCYEKNQYWLLAFHETLPVEYIHSEEQCRKLLIKFYDILPAAKRNYNLPFIIDKYASFENKATICNKVMDILLNQSSINIEHHFIEYLLNQQNLNVEKIKKLYLSGVLNIEHFDYKRKVFIQLLQLDNIFIIQYLDTIHYESISLRNFYEEHFELIWDLENHEAIIMTAIEYIANRPIIAFNEDIYAAFFMNLDKNENKALKFIHNFINKHYNKEEYISIIFAIIANTIPKEKCRFIEQFLRLNNDFNIFRNIYFFPCSGTCSGSWIPHIQHEIIEWKSILETVQHMDMGIKLLNHCEYIERQIKFCEENIKQESKREFIDRYRA